jgi:hypothetical protein
LNRNAAMKLKAMKPGLTGRSRYWGEFIVVAS